MQPDITFNDLLLEAINGNWSSLKNQDLPDWLSRQSRLEQKTSLVGIALLESMMPVVSQEENPSSDEQIYPAPIIVPLFHQVLQFHKYHLLNEILILLHQFELPLPAFVVPDLLKLSERVFKQKPNLRYLMPDWISSHHLPIDSWATYTQIPSQDDLASTNVHERLFLLRHLKLNKEEIDLEFLNNLWSAAKTPERLQVLNIIKGTSILPDFLHDKLNVRSKDLKEAIKKIIMKAKSPSYDSALEIIRTFWEKGDPRLLTMSNAIRTTLNQGLGLAEMSTSSVYQYLEPSDISSDYEKWKALHDDTLNDQEVKDFLLGSLLFEDLRQIKLWMDHERFFIDDNVLQAVADLTLTHYNLMSEHIVRNGKMKTSDILRWLLCRKGFMSKPLSTAVGEFIGKSINQEVDLNALTDLIHDFCFRADPTIYQYVLNLRERNSLAPKSILLAMDSGLEDLRIRLQFRNLLSTK